MVFNMWKSKIENRNLNWFESFKLKIEKKIEKKRKTENPTLGQIPLGPVPIRPRGPLPSTRLTRAIPPLTLQAPAPVCCIRAHV
jgi:hypothetical protein